jgi:phosphoribosyl-AMP cyclohydrolase
MEALLKELTFRDGLLPVVVADTQGAVLVLCYMDEEALRLTLRTGLVHVYRRSQERMMLKGETSGHTQHVREVRLDCEGNSLLLIVDQKVGACHVGFRTCYYRRFDRDSGAVTVCEERVFDPEAVYGRQGVEAV